MGASPAIYPDTFLTNVSQEFTNPGYAASKVLPRVVVPAISGRVLKAGLERFHRYNTARAIGGEAREMIRTAFVNDVYLCAKHDIKKLVADDERNLQNSPGFEIDVTVTNELTDVVLLDIEFGAYNLITAGVSGAALSGVNMWSDYVNSDPVAAVLAQHKTVLKGATRKPNKLALGYDSYMVLQTHPKIIDRLKFTGRDNPNPANLAGLFQVDEVVVLDGLYDATANAASGAFGSIQAGTSPLDLIWKGIALLAFIPDEPAVRTPSLGYTFYYSDKATGGGPAIFRYRWEIRQGEFIEARSFWDVRLLRPQAGYLWTNTV